MLSVQMKRCGEALTAQSGQLCRRGAAQLNGTPAELKSKAGKHSICYQLAGAAKAGKFGKKVPPSI
ncbi:hypothetical protein CLOSTMETH_01012 [[Clostridium] methylpentosum DSM 5476]|uniref:Uncharacterized protein n=1 Tax=[Clostridium] methylpentosum DSM 5476 TaxID=537013 RepID=C0EAZ5_9FIRM|nr:hypothetical protein CLOSTMETH_01012 [[Clostridium] methylpentosum DSM 5476]